MKDNIPGYPGYHVTKDGKVYSKKKNGNYKLLAYKYNRFGRPMVTLFDKNNNRKHFTIHRLVALVHIPNPNNYPIVMHLDDNVLNNTLKNLQWGTKSMNMKDAYNKGRKVGANMGKFGEEHPRSKVSNKDRLVIYDKYNKGISQNKLAKEYNISQMQVSTIIRKVKEQKH